MPHALDTAVRICVVMALGVTAVVLYFAWARPFYGGDDLYWLRHSAELETVWGSRSPFRHYRPTFGTWLWTLSQLGVHGPAPWALAGLVLGAATGALARLAVRPHMSASGASLVGLLVYLNPLRQQHVYWLSGQLGDGPLVVAVGTPHANVTRVGELDPCAVDRILWDDGQRDCGWLPTPSGRLRPTPAAACEHYVRPPGPLRMRSAHPRARCGP